MVSWARLTPDTPHTGHIKSPIFRYAKRAYFIVDREGTVRFVKIQDNPLDLLEPEDVLKALRESGAS